MQQAAQKPQLQRHRNRRRPMFKKLFLLSATITLTLATCNVAHAQLAVEDPTLDGISIAELPMQQYQVQAQSFSLVNQAKSYLLDTQEFITQSGTYTTAVQIYTTAQQTFKEAVQAYNLAYLAMSAPTILYDTRSEEHTSELQSLRHLV